MDHAKPLALFFQETEHEKEIVMFMLGSLDLRLEEAIDPKRFLLGIRRMEPALCFVDVSTPKKDIAIAIIRTIRSVLGLQPPIIALVAKGDNKTMDRLKTVGITAIVEKPISKLELAKKLSAYVVTDRIAELLAQDSSGAGADVKNRPEIPRLLDWHFERVTPALIELRDCLRVFDDVEVQLKYYSERLEPWKDQVIRMVKIMRKSRDDLDLMQSLRLYGASNARNLLVALVLSARAVAKPLIFNAQTGLLSDDPRKIITYAIRAIEHFGEESRYREVAFNSGLVLDLLCHLSAELGEHRRPILKIVESSFTEALRRADKAFSLGKSASDLALEHHLVTILMLREAGKVAMGICYPEYIEFSESYKKNNVRRFLQYIVEEKKYSISANMAGAMIAQIAPGLSLAWKSVLFYDYPFMLGRAPEDHDAWALANVCRAL